MGYDFIRIAIGHRLGERFNGMMCQSFLGNNFSKDHCNSEECIIIPLELI